MCGIIAYTGPKEAYPSLINGLKKLEYRGYDSAGIAIQAGKKIKVWKRAGKVNELDDFLSDQEIKGTTGIGHTRWATHGGVNDTNAHPHLSASGRLAIVHNGILENYDVLKNELIEKGYVFNSETDTEIFVNYIEYILLNKNCELEEALRITLKKVVGAYAIVLIDKKRPQTLIAVRKGSPLVIGIGNNECFIASDVSPIVSYTDKVVFVNDGELVIIHEGALTIKDPEDIPATPCIQEIQLDASSVEKGTYAHYMLKEIFEQPKAIADCMRGRLCIEQGRVVLGGIRQYAEEIKNTNRLIIVACGTSRYAGLVAEYWIEKYCKVPVEVEFASEFRYREPVIQPGDVVLGITQSGETADTLGAVQLAKEKGAIVLGVCNVVSSTIAREAHAGVYTHAGPEIGVASTKAFTSQLVTLLMMGLWFAEQKKKMTNQEIRLLLEVLQTLPAEIEKVLHCEEKIKEIAKLFYQENSFMYIGRGEHYPLALEGALKLKELAYIHAEAHTAAEMKHGPLALVDDQLPIFAIALKNELYPKIVSNLQELKARGGRLIAIVTEGDHQVKRLADHVITLPSVSPLLMPITAAVPLQLFAYHVALLRGCNVDQPRNLAKSVTVE